MNLANKYNIYDALAKVGILPNDKNKISKYTIFQAVKNYINSPTTNIVISCINDGLKIYI
jgi:hypothetical protein